MIRCSDQIADHHLMVYRVQDCNAWSSSAVHDACDVCRAMWNNLDNNFEASEATEQYKYSPISSLVHGIIAVYHFNITQP